ncbi:MAG: YbhB/YbcL family Raf kinase inhibitor-like protein [Cardiobacteriaceae bacterium]|nr:YbhB/YbcL family Raf kinase inhibitor-like protein [Cardiobacteriaceae bacterium]
MTTFTLSSTTLHDNNVLPLAHVHHDAGGANRSPELHWEHAPTGTKSFALSCYDPDAPTGSGFWHWYIINIPANIHHLAENAAEEGLPTPARHARNDYGTYHYGGACPPPGHGTHRYIFTIYALDCEQLNLPVDTTTARVGFNVWAHTLASASLTCTYSR